MPGTIPGSCGGRGVAVRLRSTTRWTSNQARAAAARARAPPTHWSSRRMREASERAFLTLWSAWMSVCPVRRSTSRTAASSLRTAPSWARASAASARALRRSSASEVAGLSSCVSCGPACGNEGGNRGSLRIVRATGFATGAMARAAGGVLTCITNLRVTALAPQPTRTFTVTVGSVTFARAVTRRFLLGPRPCTSSIVRGTSAMP